MSNVNSSVKADYDGIVLNIVNLILISSDRFFFQIYLRMFAVSSSN